MSKDGIVQDNRAEGFRSDACVKPSAVSASAAFRSMGEPPDPMTIDRMVSMAKEQGLSDAETDAARFLFGRIGYQHLSGYISLVARNDIGVPTTLGSVWGFMCLDGEFQAILMESIGYFELQLRTQYSIEMTSRYGAFAHRNSKLFKDSGRYGGFLYEYRSILKACAMRLGSQQERAISRYSDMPLWMAVEEMPLGMVSKLYKNTRSKAVRNAIAASFGVDKDLLTSWMTSLTFVRNRCAHHGHLLGLQLPVMPRKIECVSADNGNPFYICLLYTSPSPRDS